MVHTANLIHCDNNFKSQGLWVQDFPPKASRFYNLHYKYHCRCQEGIISRLKIAAVVDCGIECLCCCQDASSPKDSEFEMRLIQYLRSLKLPAQERDHVIDLCKTHDFSSARARLICSWPGYHQGKPLKKAPANCSPELLLFNHPIAGIAIQRSAGSRKGHGTIKMEFLYVVIQERNMHLLGGS